VRLPKQFRFAWSSEVEIFPRGDEVLLREAPSNPAAVFHLVADLPASRGSNPKKPSFL